VCCGENEAEVKRRAANIGRDVEEMSRDGLVGTPAQLIEKIETYREIGVSRLYLQVLDFDDLDHVRLIASEVLRAVA
jgi:alkanesulfonate monooxygenase SsuD/methylene tetrahydromethanopterin reductase-like flavin-dependent oxidoreductase (luciferase family)